MGVVLRGATWAVGYRFDRKDRSTKLSPRLELDDSADPPRVRHVAEEVVDSWERLAKLGERCRRPGPPLPPALRAAPWERPRPGVGRGLVGVWRRGSLVEPLTAALDLARSTGPDDLAAEVLGAGEAVARESSEQHEPGVVLRLLRILIEDREPPGSTAELLDLAHSRCDEARNVDHVFSLKLKRAGDGERRRKLYRQRVALWLDEVEATEKVLKAVHLERAVEIADKSNDRALWEEATARLQRIRDEDFR